MIDKILEFSLRQRALVLLGALALLAFGLRDALRGYRELHTRAFKLLAKDGLLATFSCSHHVDDSSFLQTITDALGGLAGGAGADDQ